MRRWRISGAVLANVKDGLSRPSFTPFRTLTKMTSKEEASRSIFGLGRQDGCIFRSLGSREETAIAETLDLTDKLDTIYDRSRDSADFLKALNEAATKHKDAALLLPTKDIRTQLLATTLKGYEDLGALIVGGELGCFQQDTIAAAAAVRTRKLFLRKILSNDLDRQGQDFLNYLLGDNVTQNGDSTHVKIPLPVLTKGADAKAHPFPLQVSIQTQEFIHAVLFYAMFADTAAGEYVRLPEGLKDLERKLSREGLTTREWERGWNFLERYQPIFNNMIFQNVVILIRSHWDWYVRQISQFVTFARHYIASPVLNKKQEKDLDRIGWAELTRQLSILEHSCGLTFNLPNSTLAEINEMSLVRNLGLHNRWEVDDVYLKTTCLPNWELKDVRIIEIGDLQRWARSLSILINETSFQIAVKYAAAPNFP
jgi:hypothetical protein